MREVMAGDPEVVELAFVPTVDDQVRVAREIVPLGRRRWLVALLAIIVVNAGAQVWREGPAALLGFAGIALGVAAGAASVLLRPAFLARWAVARHGRKHPAIFLPVEYRFGAGGLRIESEFGTSELPWSSFTRAKEADDHFLFSFTSGQTFFAPRRALREGDEPRLRALLRSHLGTRAELRQSTDG